MKNSFSIPSVILNFSILLSAGTKGKFAYASHEISVQTSALRPEFHDVSSGLMNVMTKERTLNRYARRLLHSE